MISAGEQHQQRHEHQPPRNQVVGVVRKGPRQEVRVSLSTFKGRTYGDVRLFVPNAQGEWVPTAKGCTVGVYQIGDLLDAVASLLRAAQEAPRC
jgi:hypothetical protein